ncbi:hypothetical protein KVR01_011183 [Diaporthe batatas]|uniref:uncharacterized protein n=1 Tax=Diaporthe batatas TaxID=748121 RepID=UPI001D049B08|nr:uncharacterized protein KVR01_011183 [Diaporthe batatas]KAG8158740.1 hypothetical protein KVR01_011183 [Diaporthe batatas]
MSLADLDGEYLASLKQAMTNLLSTPLAEFAYAQIIDGMPTRDSYFGPRHCHKGAPVLNHLELCPGIMEKTRAFRSQFDVLSLNFEPKTIQAYQDTTLGSAAFKLRLLELIVIACHNIAVYLYQLDEGAHKHAEWEKWHTEMRDALAKEDSEESRDLRAEYGPPTPFFRSYRAYKKYPNGLEDVAGYWVEYEIFGGVVLFDRGESEDECNGIYIHIPEIIDTLAPPTEKQFTDLVAFLLSPTADTDPSHCPLPIRIGFQNKWRWHHYEGMVDYNIFKFRHEVPNYPRRRRRECVVCIKDWPELDEYQTIWSHRGVCDEDLIAACEERLKRIATPTSACYHWDDEEQSRLQPDPKKQGRPPYFFDP